MRRGIKRHLLTGIARCSLCGQGMGTRIPEPGGGLRYACVNAPGRKGCGRVSILAGPTEEIVERIAAQASRLIKCGPPIKPAISAAEVGKLQIGRAEDQAALEQLARDHYSERVISKAEFLAARIPLQERIAAAERLIDQATMSRHEMCSDDASASRDDMEVGIEERRRTITARLEKVLIRPAPRPGTRRYDPTRISVVSRAGEVLAVVRTAATAIELRDGDGNLRLA